MSKALSPSLLFLLVLLAMTGSIRAVIQNYISQNNVMMFAKSYCPYCNKAKDLLKSLKVPFENVDLDLVDNGAEIQNDLAQLSGQRTVPNIFIKGKHIGGCDKLHALHADGKLLPLLNSDEKSEL